MSTQMQMQFPFVVSKTDLQLQDLAVNLDDVTLLQDSSVFRLDQLIPRPYES